MRAPLRGVPGLALAAFVLLVAIGCSDPSGEADEPEPPPATVEVEVYFANDRLGDPCGEVFPVSRRVSADDPVTATLQALLAGPTAAEQDQGYGGWFSADTAAALVHVEVIDQTAYVTFSDVREVIPNASSSCGSAGLLAQLDTTLRALDGIDAARYALADTDAFYAWLQLSTTPDQPDSGPPSEPDTPESDSEATAGGLTVERIATQIAADVGRSEGLAGVEVVCDLTGPVQAGDVSACHYLVVDEGIEGSGLLFAVLDAETVAWLPWLGTDYPTSTAALRSVHAQAPTGLLCHDLLSGLAPYPFDGSGLRSEEAYFSSVLYWNLEGQPARMDADGDGIPCETLHDPAVISAVLHGITP